MWGRENQEHRTLRDSDMESPPPRKMLFLLITRKLPLPPKSPRVFPGRNSPCFSRTGIPAALLWFLGSSNTCPLTLLLLLLLQYMPFCF